MSRSWIILGSCILFWVAAAPGLAGTALYVQGVADGEGLNPAGQHDFTQLRGAPGSGTPTLIETYNRGALTLVSLGREKTLLSRALLRFPLAGLAGRYSRLTGARLVLHLNHRVVLDNDRPHLPLPITIQLHRILAANADWAEGSAADPAEIPGAVCWAWRKTSSTPWQGARGCGQAGQDYVSAPVAAASLVAAPWVDGTRLVFTISSPSFLDDWIRHPAHNAGFLLRSTVLENRPTTDTVLIKFHSDDAANPLLRPRLEIDYDSLADEPLAGAPFQAGVSAGAPDAAYDAPGTSLCSAGGLTYGAAPELCVGVAPAGGRWRSIMRFDLARLAARAGEIRALRLKLTVRNVPADAQTGAAFHLFQLDRIAPANAGWREGILAAGVDPGAAAWEWLAQGARPWAGGATAGAGLQVAGVDYAASPLAQRVLVPAELSPGDPVIFDFTCSAELRDWLLNPPSNAGFRLSSPTLEAAGPSALGQVHFDSDDSSATTRRPLLEVIYANSSAADSVWLSHP